jgi:hypothetical protein
LIDAGVKKFQGQGSRSGENEKPLFPWEKNAPKEKGIELRWKKYKKTG